MQRTIVATLATVAVSARTATAVPAATQTVSTGALLAGDYLVEVSMGYVDTPLAGKGLTCEHRNAAGNGTVTELGICPAGATFAQWYNRITVAANETIRVMSLAIAGAAGAEASATIRVYKLPPA